MDKLIKAFTDDLHNSYKIAVESKLKFSDNISNVLICGMGGSGIGGKIVCDIVKNECSLPIVLCSDYTIPNFVNTNSLVIASSYSGNTEETLSAVEFAHQKGAKIVGVCSGGELEKFCKKNNYDCIVVPGGNQPRAALGYSIVQLLNILAQFKLISNSWKSELEKAILLINNDLENNKILGEKIANFLFKKIPIIYTESAYDSVGIRARQQFNENSKVLGWSISIPEMNHNELVGWGGGNDDFAVIFVQTDDINKRNKLRMDLTKDIVETKTKNIFVVSSKGSGVLQRLLYLINVFDWASFYLHKLNNVDVFDIKVINFLKNELAKE